jgi:NAD(P)H-dependent flavin oxidoreductase YrpB (nitropropane dioxygenase family)
MGGGAATGALAGAVSRAGGLGTVGMMAPAEFAAALAEAVRAAGGRPVAANLLAPFIRRGHVDACVDAGAALVVLHGGLPRAWLERLRARGLRVLVTVGEGGEARRALAAGADGLVVQGCEAGGHLLGGRPVEQALVEVLPISEGLPVLAAGGVAEAADAERLLAIGATAAVAGTRFLLTEESDAHPDYKLRVKEAKCTIETLLFGLGWPLRHRVVANAATERWCARDDRGPAAVRALGRLSAPGARLLPMSATSALAGLQRPRLPLFGPALPLADMPARSVDSCALYAGRTVARLHDVIGAASALERLAPR